jgi:hypothetical protein
MKKFVIALALGTIAATAATIPVAAIAASAAAAITIGQPPEGMGQVVFFRPGGMGGIMGCQINENGARVSALGSSRYFVTPATAGTHEYYAQSEAKDTLTLEVEPGETYYVRCKIKMGIMVGRPNISPSSPEEFAKYSGKLKEVDADDQGPKEQK